MTTGQSIEYAIYDFAAELAKQNVTAFEVNLPKQAFDELTWNLATKVAIHPDGWTPVGVDQAIMRTGPGEVTVRRMCASGVADD